MCVEGGGGRGGTVGTIEYVILLLVLASSVAEPTAAVGDAHSEEKGPRGCLVHGTAHGPSIIWV